MDTDGKWWSGYCPKWRLAGILLIAVGAVIFAEKYPFRDLKFTQYDGDLGIRPYQGLIDYARERGALTFWAHPEAENIENTKFARIETKEYTDYLIKSRGYTGFAVFYEGYDKVGRPDGIWDMVLNEYCEGRRDSPVWAIGGLAIENTDNLDRALKDLRTVLLVNALNKEEALKALSEGRLYAMKGLSSPRFVLDKFAITDTSGQDERTMGGELELSGEPILKVNGHFSDGEKTPCRIKVIKNGMVDKTFDVDSPFEISYEDKCADTGRKTYYRIEIGASGLLVVSNPIFVRKAAAAVQ